MIESNWNQDPFLHEKKQLADESDIKNKTPTPVFVYSGFIGTGNRILAVINDIEYKVGETVKDSSYTIERITPDQVILSRSNDGATIALHLQEG